MFNILSGLISPFSTSYLIVSGPEGVGDNLVDPIDHVLVNTLASGLLVLLLLLLFDCRLYRAHLLVYLARFRRRLCSAQTGLASHQAEASDLSGKITGP